MRTVVLASQKGGVGKSTLAASLAACAASDGEMVVAVDLDPQGSFAEWGRLRQAERGVESNLRFRVVRPADLSDFHRRVMEHGATTTLLIDTAGTFDSTVDQALRHSTLCLVPTRASAPDLKALRPTIERLRFLERKFAFVLNGVDSRSPGRTADALAVLKAAGDVASVITQRAAFADSMASGFGVTELDARGAAASEVNGLWSWLKGRG
ncbi:ParA family protein [Methylobacterium nonmethylotrophicum]|nr:ParA family protein [Methylobacterium nonmethylotrophicum]